MPVSDSKRPKSTTRGFKRTSLLVKDRVQKVSEGRGFAVSKLLTHWAEIVGPETAAMAKPVNVGYGRGAFGATLTLLTTGANAPILQMQVEKLKDRVNACYGYSAIKHIRITQTASTGFAEGKVAFAPAPKPNSEPDSVAVERARAAAAPVADEGLRSALEKLGETVISRTKSKLRHS